MFFVLEGTLTLQVEDEELAAGPGTFVCVPPGTPHRFANTSDAPVRMLNLNTPGGFEGYMRELAEAGAAAAKEGRALGPEDIGAIASKYDFRPA
jgi:mannose-6-phosphate isomerase-like protein (cupin superfamily)